MKRTVEERLKATLTEAIETWFQRYPEDTMPLVGDDIAEIMAAAALAVLRGIADAQQCAVRDGYLKEG